MEKTRDSLSQAEFLGFVAHEMNNPLGTLGTCTDLLSYEDLSDGGKTAIALMRRQLAILSRLSADLMDLTRLATGKLACVLESVVLREVLEASVQMVAKHYREKCHRLFLDIPSQPLTFLSDPIRLQQVLSNLLVNAAKYTPPGGEITLGARVDGDSLVIWVRDNGVGISRENLAAIFDLFSQEKRSQRMQSGGVGIGLSLVRGLVTMMGGRVEAESQGEGLGSEFRVILPFVPSPADPDHDWSREDRMRVLLIEDDSDNARSMRMILEHFGHTVVVAADGRSGLSASQQQGFDLVLVDLNLPDGDGVALCARLRDRQPRARICALSGYGREEDRIRTRDAGFDEHFAKPLAFDDLRRYMDSLHRVA